MVFNSIDFLVFFPIVIAVYYVIPCKLRKFWLLVSSYYFYMSWNATYAILIFLSTFVTYLSGLLIEKRNNRKLWVALSFVINLSILFFFKYWDFLISNLNFIISKTGISISNPFNLLLPVGISFYTFQALSYTVDVYRKEVEVEHNFINYALFVSFFPQLVAGPIERSKNLLTQVGQLDRKKLFSYDKMVSGLGMMCYGMFLKVVLADHLAVFVNSVWNNLQLVGMTEGLVAAFAFSIQIYCDFGAYSMIAIGAARMMGFDLMENFNTPYFATSIADFWRRWHISLSTWFKDYLYIPMGGSRCSKIKKYRNLLVTFLVSGLWHGASWNYVLWGGIHGMYQIVGDILKPVKVRVRRFLQVDETAESFKLGQIIITFMLTTFAWVFFRAKSLKEALLFFECMIRKINPWALFDKSLYQFGLDYSDFHLIIFALLVLLVVDIIRYKKQVDFGEFLKRQNVWFRWIVLLGLIVGTVVYGAYGMNFESSQFIYFQF